MSDLSTFKKGQEHTDENLRGTLILVFFIGSIILLSWIGVFSIYLARL